MFQPWVAVAITNLENQGTGEVLAFALDVGLTSRLQAGIFFAFPVDPHADFGTFVFDLQLGLAKGLNLRVDVGGEQVVFSAPSSSFLPSRTESGFLVGVGLSWKVKLHRMLALIGGSPNAPGFGFYPVAASKRGDFSVYTTAALS